MSFQWIFDTAQSISADTKNIVGQTVSRNGTVRATSRGSTGTTFTVKLPDGMPWDDVADYIETIETKNRYTEETVALSNSGYTSWLHNGQFTSGQTWDVICIQMPTWTINARNQVSWSGPFVFHENLV